VTAKVVLSVMVAVLATVATAQRDTLWTRLLSGCDQFTHAGIVANAQRRPGAGRL
jgi:hypothetical protein